MTLGKTPKESLSIMSNFVLPNESNAHGSMFGGELLALMDRLSAIAAQRHSEHAVVTACVNYVSFKRPIPLGAIVTMEARVSCVFSSSIEVFVDVWAEDIRSDDPTKTKTGEGIYTLVAKNAQGETIKNITQLIPETSLEKERFAGALRRKQLALLIGGKIKPDEATELKDLFFNP